MDEGDLPNSWFIEGLDYKKSTSKIVSNNIKEQINSNGSESNNNERNLLKYNCNNGVINFNKTMDSKSEDLRELLRLKAEKHRNYYKTICDTLLTNSTDLLNVKEMATVTADCISGQEYTSGNGTPTSDLSEEVESTPSNKGTFSGKQKQRRTGVYEINSDLIKEETKFTSVKELKAKYQAMLEQTTEKLKKNNLLKPEKKESKIRKNPRIGRGVRHSMDDGYLLPPPSGYCSSSASGASDDERDKVWFSKEVRRSGSSDSAVGLTQSDDEITGLNSRQLKYDYNYIRSPYSPRGSVDHINVPSKTIIEAQCLPFPINRKFSDCISEGDYGKNDCDSRRQSCFTDDGDEIPKYRYWRTPSVVVSDYSDDIIGITLDDIEYFRNQQRNSSSPESSTHSSCSNLNYCGSTISCLDSERLLRKPYRKESDCSLQSFSGDENEDDKSDEGKYMVSYKEVETILLPFVQSSTYNKNN